MTAQIEDARLKPLDPGPVSLSESDFNVLDLTDAELAATARNIAAIDAVMAAEDVAALEAAFAADDAAPATSSTAGEAEYRSFVLLYERPVRNLLRRYLRRPQDVDECAQDVFLKVWLCWKPEQTDDHRRALVFRVTRNTAFDRLRSKAFREYEKTVFHADVDDLLVADDAPDQELVRAERIAKVHAAVDTLPPNQRDLIRARWFQGESFADLAESQGTTSRALITQQTRIFKKLRLRLAHASAAPLTRPGLWQRLRNLVSSIPPDVTHAALIGVMVTSLVAARPAGVVPAPPEAADRGAHPVAMEWLRPTSVAQSSPAGAGDSAAATHAVGSARPPGAPANEGSQPKRPIPSLPIPTPNVDVGPCDEGPDGDQITVEAQPLGVTKCRKQNIVEVCPLVPQNAPGVTCQTQGKPSYLIPLPKPEAGIP